MLHASALTSVWGRCRHAVWRHVWSHCRVGNTASDSDQGCPTLSHTDSACPATEGWREAGKEGRKSKISIRTADFKFRTEIGHDCLPVRKWLSPYLFWHTTPATEVVSWNEFGIISILDYPICSLNFPYLAAIDQTSPRLKHIGVRKSLILGIDWKSGVSETRSRGLTYTERETEREKIEFWQYCHVYVFLCIELFKDTS